MKKYVISLVILLISTGIYFGYSYAQPKIANYPSSNTGVVAFGDSLIYGTGGSNSGGFVKMISDDLNLPITNLGVVGNTTQDALKRINEVVKLKPKVTIILLGGNDFLKGVPQNETFKNLGTIIEKIQSTGSVVLLVGLEPLVSTNHERESFDELAKIYKTAYVPDILHGIYGHPDLMSDNLHPNDAGYRLMANKIKSELKRVAY